MAVNTFSLFYYTATAAYLLVTLSGVYGVHTPGWGEAIRHPFFATWSLVGLILEIVSLKAAQRTGGTADLLSAGSLLRTGLMLVFAGVIISYFCRYEGALLIAEGQPVETNSAFFGSAGSYRGKFASDPGIGQFTCGAISPRLFTSGYGYHEIKASVHVFGKSGGEETKDLSSLFPRLVGPITFLQITDFGYAPRGRLTGKTGIIVFEAYHYLRIFPPGAEDSFRVFKLPYTFSLRFYPDATMIDDPSFPARERKGPVVGFRVTKNIFMLSRGHLGIGEKADVPGSGLDLSIEDVRKWVEITIVRDPGLWPMAAGALLFSFSSLITLWRKL